MTNAHWERTTVDSSVTITNAETLWVRCKKAIHKYIQYTNIFFWFQALSVAKRKNASPGTITASRVNSAKSVIRKTITEIASIQTNANSEPTIATRIPSNASIASEDSNAENFCIVPKGESTNNGHRFCFPSHRINEGMSRVKVINRAKAPLRLRSGRLKSPT